MLKNNAVLKILSLLLAIALWAFVLGEVNPEVKKTIYGVPVEFTNLEYLENRDLAMVTQDGYTVDIVVKGARSDVGQLELSDIQATADMYGYGKGENRVAVEVTVPGKISLHEVKTPDITVVIENMASVSKPVTVEFTGSTPEETEPSAVKVTPSLVEVKGAESVIAKVDSVVVEIDSVELTEVNSVFYATPSAKTAKGRLIKGVSISATTVEVDAVLHHIKTVALEVNVTGSPEGNATVTIPEEITVKGSVEALSRITSVSARSVNISDVDETQIIPLELTLPYGVELAKISEDIGIKVEFK